MLKSLVSGGGVIKQRLRLLLDHLQDHPVWTIDKAETIKLGLRKVILMDDVYEDIHIFIAVWPIAPSLMKPQ